MVIFTACDDNPATVEVDAYVTAIETVYDYDYAVGMIFDLGRVDTGAFSSSDLDFVPGDSIADIKVYVSGTGTGGTTVRLWVDPIDINYKADEMLETGMTLLDSGEHGYTVHPTDFWIRFDVPFGGADNEIGVYPEVKRQGGETEIIGNVSQEPYRLKLIRRKDQSPVSTTWYYEWRNIYAIGIWRVTNLDIIKGVPDLDGSKEKNNGQDGYLYISILGLDRYDGAGESHPDSLVDINTPIIDNFHGLLIFPNRRPFNTDITFCTFPALEDRVPEIYTGDSYTGRITSSKYCIVATFEIPS